MEFDVPKLKAEIRAQAAALVELRKASRESGQPRFGVFEQNARRHLRAWFTLLCAARAHRRGRVHGHHQNQAQQAVMLEAGRKELTPFLLARAEAAE